MKSIITSAPGKIVIIGEFAVLKDAPSISMAINRRAIVSIKEIQDSSHIIKTHGIMESEWRFNDNESGEFIWLGSEPQKNILKLFVLFWRKIKIESNIKYKFTLDTSMFFDPVKKNKLGLGSSSALIVAMSIAFIKFFDISENINDLAHQIHSEFQSGLGSGVDVQTALDGGLIRYLRQEKDNAIGIKFPNNFMYKILWSGKPVSTEQKLKSLKALKGDIFQDFSEITRKLSSHWTLYDKKSFVDDFDQYLIKLKNFSDHFNLDLLGAKHGLIVDHAMSFKDSVYKPCGAGGDIGICISSSDTNLNSVVDYAESLGFISLDITCDDEGYKIESING